MLLRCRIDITPQCSALHLCQAAQSASTVTPRISDKVDHHAAVTDRMPRNIVPATTNGDGQVTGNRKLDGGLHVARSSALSDQRGAAIYHGVPNTPRTIKSRVLGPIISPPNSSDSVSKVFLKSSILCFLSKT